LNLSQILKKSPFLGYLFAAGSGVLVQYFVASFVCIHYFGLSYKTSVRIGFLCSVPVGFILAKIFAFDSKRTGNTPREVFKYAISLFFSYLITTEGAPFFLNVLRKSFGNGEMITPIFNYTFNWIGTVSHFAAMGLSFVFNFFYHRYLTFAETGIFDKIFNSKA
jgi:putative flippase GtrA